MGELLKAPRGTADILPPQISKWLYVEGVMRRIAEQYGYEEIRTPLFEQTELFSRGIGEGTDIVSKEMYTFTDKGGRSLTLRPELTAPAVRAYLENQLTQQALVKWYYLGPGFRYERPQSGRYRQFYQFGIEAIGAMNPALDAEVIALSLEIFHHLDLKDLEVRLNSIGCSVCRPRHREALVRYFSPLLNMLCSDCKSQRFEKNPLRILDCKVQSCVVLMKDAPVSRDLLCEECRLHFEKVQGWLAKLNVRFLLDPYLVRGLDYYTKTVFEVTSSALGAQNSLCGGGRYDQLVEALSGPKRPAVGFAAGIERIILVMENLQVRFPPREPDLYAIALGEEAEAFLFPIIFRLRRQGLHVRTDYHGRSLGAKLKEADKFGARWVLLVGEAELASKKAILRNMQTRHQEELPLEEVESQTVEKIYSETKREVTA